MGVGIDEAREPDEARAVHHTVGSRGRFGGTHPGHATAVDDHGGIIDDAESIATWIHRVQATNVLDRCRGHARLLVLVCP